VVETEPAALVVANRGLEFPTRVVLDSLGQIGRSTKTHGEAIGHKGIGFKSVLEVSPTPELYFGLGTDGPTLAVRFDATEALEVIRQHTPDWDDMLRRAEDFGDRPVDAVPILRYPGWVENVPAVVDELSSYAGTGLDSGDGPEGPGLCPQRDGNPVGGRLGSAPRFRGRGAGRSARIDRDRPRTVACLEAAGAAC
jgi:hypothetical protein